MFLILIQIVSFTIVRLIKMKCEREKVRYKGLVYPLVFYFEFSWKSQNFYNNGDGGIQEK